MHRLKLLIILEFISAFVACLSGLIIGAVGLFSAQYANDPMKYLILVTAIGNMVVAVILGCDAKKKWNMFKKYRRGIMTTQEVRNDFVFDVCFRQYEKEEEIAVRQLLRNSGF